MSIAPAGIRASTCLAGFRVTHRAGIAPSSRRANTPNLQMRSPGQSVNLARRLLVWYAISEGR